MSDRIAKDLANLVTAFAFVGLVSMPAAVMFMQPSAAVATTENRMLAPFPHWSWDWAAISEYPSAFEKYFDDAFGLRPKLTHWHHLAFFRVFGISPTKLVVVGKDNCLFLDYSMQMYRRDVSFTDEEIALQANLLQQRHDWLASLGIKYLVVLVPNKPEVYPEYVPANSHQRWPESHTDRLEAYARNNCSFDLLNLRSSLTQARKQHETYNLSDCHWNDFGAFVGYRAVMDRVAKHFPELKPATLDQCSIETRQQAGDLMRMIGLPELDEPRIFIWQPNRRARGHEAWTGLRNSTLITTVDDERLPKAVVMHDSFMGAMFPFLAEHFRETTFRYIYTEIDPQAIIEHKPDIVIQEVVERAMHELKANPPDVRAPITPALPRSPVAARPATNEIK